MTERLTTLGTLRDGMRFRFVVGDYQIPPKTSALYVARGNCWYHQRAYDGGPWCDHAELLVIVEDDLPMGYHATAACAASGE